MAKTTLTRKDFAYFHRMTSRWRDNDVFAHVNNAVFYEYIDTVVNYWLIDSGSLAVPSSDVVGLVVRSECDFYAPLVFPGEVYGGLRAAHVGKSSVRYEVGLFSGEDNAPAAVAGFTHVYVDKGTRRPVALPDGLRSGLERIAG